MIFAFLGDVSCGVCPLGTATGLTSPFYGAPGPNPGGSERLLADWIGLGLMSNPGLWASDRLWVRPAYCLAVVCGRERTLVPMPGSLRGRPSRGRAGSPAVGAVGGRVVHPQPVCAAGPPAFLGD